MYLRDSGACLVLADRPERSASGRALALRAAPRNRLHCRTVASTANRLSRPEPRALPSRNRQSMRNLQFCGTRDRLPVVEAKAWKVSELVCATTLTIATSALFA